MLCPVTQGNAVNDPRTYFPFYPGDFWGADEVVLMDLEAAGLYLLLLSREWTEGSLSANERFLEALAGSRIRDWATAWAQVKPCFFERDGRLFNKRLEEERKVADDFSEKQSKAATAKWKRFRESRGSAVAVPPHSRGNATAMPLQDSTGQDRTVQDQEAPSAPADERPAWEQALVWFHRLDTPAVRASCLEWESYRREYKHKAWKASTWKTNFKALAPLGPQATVDTIQRSIRSTWQGLFPAPGGPAANGTQTEDPIAAIRRRQGMA